MKDYPMCSMNYGLSIRNPRRNECSIKCYCPFFLIYYPMLLL